MPITIYEILLPGPSIIQKKPDSKGGTRKALAISERNRRDSFRRLALSLCLALNYWLVIKENLRRDDLHGSYNRRCCDSVMAAKGGLGHLWKHFCRIGIEHRFEAYWRIYITRQCSWAAFYKTCLLVRKVPKHCNICYEFIISQYVVVQCLF